MRNRHGAVLGQEQKRRRLAHQDGSADHDDIPAREIIAERTLGENDTACRRAWTKAGLAENEPSGAGFCQAVDILGGRDAFNGALLIKALGQWQLQQDAINLGIIVEARNQGFDLILRCVCRQVMVQRAHAGLFGLLDLVANIDLACRVFANEDNGERGLPRKARNGLCDLCADVCRDLLAVNPFSHAPSTP